MTKKHKNSKIKKEPTYKTKEERLTEVLEIYKKLSNLGLTDDYDGITEFKTELRGFVNDGEFRQGKIKVIGSKRIIEYMMPKIKDREITINLKYDPEV